jgi:hypothetical protein
MPIGTIVIRKRTYGDKRTRALETRYIKVRDDGPMQLRWVAYARWWWEQNRGPVPAGQMVLHLDMNTINDDPSNLMLGDASTKIALCHKLDPEMSKRNRIACKAGTSEFNRFTDKLHRLREVLMEHWYPVLDEVGVIFNVPFLRRPDLLRWFGADTSSVPKNWRGPAAAAARNSAPVRPVIGKDLKTGIISSYPRIDLEWEIGAGGGAFNAAGVEMKVRELKKNHRKLWNRALEGARQDLTNRAQTQA